MIKTGLSECLNSLSNKHGLHPDVFSDWIYTVLQNVDAKIETLKRRLKTKISKPFLERDVVKDSLISLKNKFVIVPIDKATNNVAFICKRFYAKVLLEEMGILTKTSNTYRQLKNKSVRSCIISHIKIMKSKFNIDIEENNKHLPIAYCIPKMHKSPISFRFIIASNKCVTKQLSQYVTSAFKLFFEQIKTYHDKIYFFSGIKSFWIIQNNQPVIQSISKINSRNSAKCVSSFDFSTLYTMLPHDKLLDVLEKLICFCFKGGTRRKIGISSHGTANWITNATKKLTHLIKMES